MIPNRTLEVGDINSFSSPGCGLGLSEDRNRNAVPIVRVTERCSALQPDREGMTDQVADGEPMPRKRADARRNEEALLGAAAAAFVASGVDVPVRDIAARAGVGVGTIYRHFPTRADLIVAVYRHQVEACAEAGAALLDSDLTPHAALRRWIHLFVDFLVTKHGLAAVLKSDTAGFDALHAYFID